MGTEGIAAKGESAVQWECMGDREFVPYEEDVNASIEEGRARGLTVVEVRLGPQGWKYEIDIGSGVQRNAKTRTVRPIRQVAASARKPKSLAQGYPLKELRKEIRYYVDLC